MSNHDATLTNALKRKLSLTTLMMKVERLWPVVWGALCMLAFYAALSLFDIWLYLDDAIRVGLYNLCLFLSAFLAMHKYSAYQSPTLKETMRRLEDNSGLIHRPLDSLMDELAGAPKAEAALSTVDRFKVSLWHTHLDQMHLLARSTKVPFPRFSLKQHDPFLARFLLPLLLVGGLVVANKDWQARLEAGFSFQSGTPATNAIVDMWISPPDYTGMGPRTVLTAQQGIHFKNTDAADQDPIIVPENSVIEIRVHNSGRRPRLETDQGTVVFSGREASGFELKHPLQNTNSLTLDLGSGLSKTWPLQLALDTAPTISFVEKPKATDQQALEVNYAFRDDYGLKNAVMEIHRAGFSNGDRLRLDLPHIHQGSELVNRAAFFDLTAHRWAGMTVNAMLYATDALGQYGESDTVSFIMPERIFQNPVAQELVSIRKSLFISPERVDGPRRRLDLLAQKPENFDSDLLVYTGLKSAYYRLKWTPQHDDTKTVTDLLWNLALKLEDGGLSLGKEQMNSALQELQQALEQGDNEKFDELADELDKGLEDLMRQLAQSPQPQNQRANLSNDNVQTIDMETIKNMIQQMRELAAAGKTEEAQKILEQLKQILSNIQMSNGPSEEEYQQLMEGSKALSKLDGIKDQQQDLNDETKEEQALEELRERAGVPADTDSMAERQQQLEQGMQDVEDSLGKAQMQKPEGMDQAKDAMERATRALQQGDLDGANQAQQEALDGLEQARDQLSKEMARRMAQTGQGNNNQDPLGRGTDLSEELDVPDQDDVRDARQILQELREKLADPNRSDEERAYIRRLIRRFEQK